MVYKTQTVGIQAIQCGYVGIQAIQCLVDSDSEMKIGEVLLALQVNTWQLKKNFMDEVYLSQGVTATIGDNLLFITSPRSSWYSSGHPG